MAGDLVATLLKNTLKSNKGDVDEMFGYGLWVLIAILRINPHHTSSWLNGTYLPRQITPVY